MAQASVPVLHFSHNDPSSHGGGGGSPTPSTSSTLTSVDESPYSIMEVVQTILKAKRIAIICGAGISVASGIPDFRSAGGLFETIKKRYPDAKLNSGKDLFDASLFATPENTSLFYSLMGELKTMSDDADPTAFHYLLARLVAAGKVMRIYTQNIDGLEGRAGIKTGVDPKAKCLPLHGTLDTLSCPICHEDVDFKEPFLSTFREGEASNCPSCEGNEEARHALGRRPRKVGVMRPNVVLYGEAHRHGDAVGAITGKDLTQSSRPDLIWVVGTTLKVRGVKKIVKELEKVARPLDKDKAGVTYADVESEDEFPSSTQGSGFSTPTKGSAPMSRTPSRGLRRPKLPKIHSIYMNYDFPQPAKEWEDTFDVWCKGDVQEFAAIYSKEEKRVEAENEARRLKRNAADLRKRDRIVAERLEMGLDQFGNPLRHSSHSSSPLSSLESSAASESSGFDSPIRAGSDDGMASPMAKMSVFVEVPVRKRSATPASPLKKSSFPASGRMALEAVEVESSQKPRARGASPAETIVPDSQEGTVKASSSFVAPDKMQGVVAWQAEVSSSQSVEVPVAGPSHAPIEDISNTVGQQGKKRARPSVSESEKSEPPRRMSTRLSPDLLELDVDTDAPPAKRTRQISFSPPPSHLPTLAEKKAQAEMKAREQAKPKKTTATQILPPTQPPTKPKAAKVGAPIKFGPSKGNFSVIKPGVAPAAVGKPGKQAPGRQANLAVVQGLRRSSRELSS